jgi:hypothetical protein
VNEADKTLILQHERALVPNFERAERKASSCLVARFKVEKVLFIKKIKKGAFVGHGAETPTAMRALPAQELQQAALAGLRGW